MTPASVAAPRLALQQETSWCAMLPARRPVGVLMGMSWMETPVSTQQSVAAPSIMGSTCRWVHKTVKYCQTAVDRSEILNMCPVLWNYCVQILCLNLFMHTLLSNIVLCDHAVEHVIGLSTNSEWISAQKQCGKAILDMSKIIITWYLDQKQGWCHI